MERRCIRCDSVLNYSKDEIAFNSIAGYMLAYGNINKALCGTCAANGVLAKEADLYYETCEKCHKRFEYIKENELAGGTLSEMWRTKKMILCVNCLKD